MKAIALYSVGYSPHECDMRKERLFRFFHNTEVSSTNDLLVWIHIQSLNIRQETF